MGSVSKCSSVDQELSYVLISSSSNNLSERRKVLLTCMTSLILYLLSFFAQNLKICFAVRLTHHALNKHFCCSPFPASHHMFEYYCFWWLIIFLERAFGLTPQGDRFFWGKKVHLKNGIFAKEF